ncbi:hypothetical protein [Salarchaeum sp. JOR-1]|uniref:DUF7857 domain-containing protein n=1 Tax=Salarchaeum sp. JOR-1 TaxID=2599399 RepID=UPI0011983D06|nr:hypothetical protein [Salarchaeum sp. JOR-1]QDX40341.1 hypothetical protein FQU85_05300 [Salarchaeum sp. JOR-1]
MEYDARTTRGDVTLVMVLVENDAARERGVRVTNLLDGPVWPPRTNGVPDGGWSPSGYETVLAPGERRGVGYATPAPPDPNPVRVEPIEQRSSPDRLDPVRDLADPRPPRDALGPAVPRAVTAWLDDVEQQGRPTGREREALERAARLREDA